MVGRRRLGFEIEDDLERIRILMAEMPGMLGEIVKQVVDEQPDMDLVGEVAARQRLAGALRRTRPGLVVLGMADEGSPGFCDELLADHPHTKVLAVEADGRRGFLYELRPHKLPLGEVSPSRLVEVIRAAACPSSLQA